jgi:hypothetical protein
LSETPSAGATITDSKGSNNGTVSNAGGTGLSQSASQLGNGIKFDGTNYIEIANESNFDFTTNVTMTMWRKVGSGGWAADFGKNGEADGYAIRCGNTTYIKFTEKEVNGSAAINGGGWVHIAATSPGGGGTLRGYVNGTADGTTTGNIIFNGSSPVGIGAIYRGGWIDKTTATLDECRIANAERSAGWIKAEYNNQSSPSTFYTLGSQESGGASVIAPKMYYYRQMKNRCIL